VKIIKKVKLKIDENEVLRYQDYSKNKVVKQRKLFYRLLKKRLSEPIIFFNLKEFMLHLDSKIYLVINPNTTRN